MLFLEFIYFVLSIISTVNRKKIYRSDEKPTIAEIFKSRKQKKISAS